MNADVYLPVIDMIPNVPLWRERPLISASQLVAIKRWLSTAEASLAWIIASVLTVMDLNWLEGMDDTE